MEEIKVPAHVGIIMDGNGRWAQNRGKKRSFGHKEGSRNVDRIAEHAFSVGVKSVTLYAFSSENWARPKEEVDELMKLLAYYLKKLTAKAIKQKIRLNVLGSKDRLSAELLAVIEKYTAKTAAFAERNLNIMVDYGGRGEIVNAAKAAAAEGDITEESLEKHLCTAGQPALDLIIRTGGEIRLSNFLLYQAAYAEFYFTDVLWPDFDEGEFDKALADFSKRKRRYGKIEC
ncbi:MAG: di-trans,poly-cis-decaprenylcistransferase [Bacillota bacterium]|nr:MAG: di-trans,poly-cis-decaprenylcistransferase [Bacillota bacterium]